jgi:hypothetical protein
MSSIENSYNRPNFPYRCGRAAVWEKPCYSGPNPDGTCGGTAACEPRRSGDRYVCRRSREQGGPCEHDPLPDGTCALRQLPCQPRRRFRSFRFQVTMIAFIIVIALLGAFGSNGPLTSDNATLFRDPGKILDVHAAVVGERGCSSCHAPHDMDPRGFVLAVFRPSGPSQGGSNKCLACHVIAKKPGSGHSAEACTLCHAEHKGAVAPVSKITDQQCHTCHKTKFTTFSASHPEFKKTYPYVRRTAINFDHVKHLETHFKDQRFADKAPKDRCIGCHVASKASWRVPIKPFQETCAGCHEKQIGKRELTLFTFPELKKNPADPKTIADSCPGGAPKKADEYESASLEPLNPVAAALLGVDGGDISSYEGHVGALLEGMLTEGNAPISELLSKADGQPAHLLSGLAPGLLHSAACSWAANREHEAPGEPEFGGWHAGEFFLRYRALRHQDPVIKAWLDFAAAAEIEGLSKELLGVDGPGSCVKCHSVSETDAVRVEWRSAETERRALYTYSHVPHLNLLGPGSECETCHALDKKADYAAAFKQIDPKVFNSNFSAIGKKLCAACHQQGQVVENCLTCHKYHDQTGFKDRMMAGELKTQGTSQ